MKKSRDSRDVFAVFKKGSFMEGASLSEKFSYWFKNVYWYHFRFATFAVITLIILGSVFVSDVFFREYNDVDYVVAGAIFADPEQMKGLDDYISSAIIKDGEEPPKIAHQMLCTNTIAPDNTNTGIIVDEYSAISIEKISVSMANDEILLYFLDERYIKWYAEQGAFAPLSDFGIEGENEYYVRVDDTKLFRELDFWNEDGIYAAIKMKNSARLKNERIAKKYDDAAKAISAILSGK